MLLNSLRSRSRFLFALWFAMVMIVGVTVADAAEAAAKDTVAKVVHIGVVVFEGFLTSEVAAPVEVFYKPAEATGTTFELVLVAETLEPIASHEGLRILPDFTFATAPVLDVLIVPSSYNLEASEDNAEVLGFVRDRGQKVEYLASNCAGAFILGNAGLIDGKRVTTYVGGGALLQERFPKAKVQDTETAAVVVDGNLITSNGAVVTYKSSLKLLELLTDQAHANSVAEDLYLSRVNRQ